MRLSALIHLVQSVQALTHQRQVHVLGSASLLVSFPELGEPGAFLELTQDADLLVEPADDQLASVIHEAIGENSLFSARYGYHVDLMRDDILETLPQDWKKRTRPIPECADADCIDPYDLCLIKFQIGRSKDLNVCETLFREGLLDWDTVWKKFRATPLEEKIVLKISESLKALSKTLKRDSP
jgi:hypothetical protein